MKVLFLCPMCEAPGRSEVPAAQPWRCSGCDHLMPLPAPQHIATKDGVTLHQCAVCGNVELFKQKGFPHWLGMLILTTAIAGFIVLNAYRLQWWAWAVLIASAVIDGVMYLLVTDVVVCYRCGAHHRGVGRSGNSAFELTVHERYRQERIRLEELAHAARLIKKSEPPA